MKKMISITMILMLVLTFCTSTAVAKPDKAKGGKSIIQLNNEEIPGDSEIKSNNVNKQLKQELKLQKQLFMQLEKTMQFSDTNGHWAAKSIATLAELGVITGYPDGSYDPDGEMTLAEALSLIMRVTDEEQGEVDAVDEEDPILTDEDPVIEEDSFVEDEDVDEEVLENTEDTEDEDLSDVSEWAKGAAKKASQNGIININRFHSATQANRAQVAVMLAKALGIEPLDSSEVCFEDGLLISPEDYGYIAALQQQGIFSGDAQGKFNPNSAMTRAQMAEVLIRLLTEEEPIDENTGDAEIVDESIQETGDSDVDSADIEDEV
ncbi:hypothetical protein ASZ90_019677 [hydrocarbon metagenome]|uniref:SLH domain-containing protein n=1 Tax=hydrocarbon metagenome TaxID=938273 RepID=A0A0W8E2J5_9ZZZZ